MIRNLLSQSRKTLWGHVFWICIAVYILQLCLPSLAGMGALSRPVVMRWHLWTFFTYGFMHGSPMHLLFNMLGLVMMGGLESMLGMRKFAITLFGGVLVGGLAHIATVPVIPCVGLSAGLMALLAYYCLLFPSTKVLLFFVLPVKSIYFYYGSIAYSLVAWQFNLQQGVGHTAHLGGMLIGTLIFLQYKRSVRSIATLMPEVMSRDELAEELRDAYGHDV